MTKRLAAILLSMVLAACSSSGSYQPSPYQPPINPRPGTLAFAAQWPAEGIDLGVGCEEGVPPVCYGDSQWVTFDRPGTQGLACTEASPNACYTTTGSHYLIHIDEPGFPTILRDTIPVGTPSSVEMDVAAVCGIPVEGCYIGPVFYNGEMNYRALYIDRDGIAIYTPIVGRFVAPYTPGTHTSLRIDYDGAHIFKYFVNNNHVFTETPGSITAFPTKLGNDFRIAIWSGVVNATVGRFDLFRSR